jgi:hypothetical protein
MTSDQTEMTSRVTKDDKPRDQRWQAAWPKMTSRVTKDDKPRDQALGSQRTLWLRKEDLSVREVFLLNFKWKAIIGPVTKDELEAWSSLRKPASRSRSRAHTEKKVCEGGVFMKSASEKAMTHVTAGWPKMKCVSKHCPEVSVHVTELSQWTWSTPSLSKYWEGRAKLEYL